MQPDIGSPIDLAKHRLAVAAEEVRHASDYDEFYLVSKEETEVQIETAKIFIEAVDEYLRRNMDNEKCSK